MKTIKLVAFLGNYGKKYEKTRHNVAWLFSDALTSVSCMQKQSKFKGLYAKYENVHFLWPKTFMNLSGESVLECAQFYKIKIENILIVHDELELAPGFISLKWSGGLGGHNGLRSLKTCFGTADFWRLRIGIGRPNNQKSQNQDIAGYVLSPFSKDEESMLTQVFMNAEPLLNAFIKGEEPHSLLSQWKKKNLLA